MKRRYVAFIDILGFKGIVKSYTNKGEIEELGKKLSGIFNACIYAALTGEDTKVGESPKELPDDILFYQFSDSVILYTKDDSSNLRDKMIRTLNYLLARSALEGFPLRGGLVKEELFVDPPILVGEGIIKAYELEMKQGWSGVIVDKHCYNFEESEDVDLANKLLAKALVPVKHGEEIRHEKHLVINWPEFVGKRVSEKEHFKERFIKETGMPTEEKDIAKIERTLEFFEKNVGKTPLPSLVYSGVLLRGGKYILDLQKK